VKDRYVELASLTMSRPEVREAFQELLDELLFVMLALKLKGICLLRGE
jgi:hypothetical protein